MYTPSAFSEDRLPVLQAAMHDHPFACLVSAGSDGLCISHLPLLLVPEEGPSGTLYGHVARANAHAARGGAATTAIFTGPHAYVSAGLYPGRRTHGREVPTWNYVAVHAHGVLETFEEPSALRILLERLTMRHEQGHDDPWRLAEAPADHIDRLLGAITGLRLPIERLDGRWKLSQNRSDADRDAVAAGLAASDDAGDRAVARLMRRTEPAPGS